MYKNFIWVVLIFLAFIAGYLYSPTNNTNKTQSLVGISQDSSIVEGVLTVDVVNRDWLASFQADVEGLKKEEIIEWRVNKLFTNIPIKDIIIYPTLE